MRFDRAHPALTAAQVPWRHLVALVYVTRVRGGRSAATYGQLVFDVDAVGRVTAEQILDGMCAAPNSNASSAPTPHSVRICHTLPAGVLVSRRFSTARCGRTSRGRRPPPTSSSTPCCPGSVTLQSRRSRRRRAAYPWLYRSPSLACSAVLWTLQLRLTRPSRPPHSGRATRGQSRRWPHWGARTSCPPFPSPSRPHTDLPARTRTSTRTGPIWTRCPEPRGSDLEAF